MVKLMGGCLVAAASLMLGWAARRGLQTQVDLRRQLRLALELMQSEMELDMPPVAELFDRVGRQISGPVGEFFQGAAVEMVAVSGRPPQMAMRLQLETCDPGFGREVTNLLLEVGGCLGRYDILGQARALQVYKQRLDSLLSQAEETLAQRARASMTASLCGGLAVIVILL
jgi:stage III sporulation protein AB